MSREKFPETFREFEALSAFADRNGLELEVADPDDGDRAAWVLKRPGARRRSATYAVEGSSTHDTKLVRVHP